MRSPSLAACIKERSHVLKGRAPPYRPRRRASTGVHSSKLAPTMGPTTPCYDSHRTQHAGMPEALGLLWFCKSRQASLAVEQQELQNHIAAVHAAHLQHVMHSASRNASG
eukprot:scaffold15102_cov21-Tisochrysis_lutea.AAC.3